MGRMQEDFKRKFLKPSDKNPCQCAPDGKRPEARWVTAGVYLPILRAGKMVMGLEPIQVTDPLKIIIFNKHLFNWEIKKSVARGYHQNLKEAFDSALAAERKAKKFEGLTGDDPSVMAITARRQVNQVMATSENEQMPDIAHLNQTAVDGTQPTNAKFSRQKFHTNCYKCRERGHYARECPQSLAAKQIVLSPVQPPITRVPATQCICQLCKFFQLLAHLK